MLTIVDGSILSRAIQSLGVDVNSNRKAGNNNHVEKGTDDLRFAGCLIRRHSSLCFYISFVAKVL